ncbi:flagellar motor switch/type III secretory pathway protein FliN [Variovorax boronicumulans]|uniref:FliM/FliN family flagellar motor switch protein n=1 Tax=Variovorax boronicumulans TaxID=436515 RepID=UPI002784026E|nr:FliM/FliN family flagellar motor switch protein [Variovorax boronicumulans]MDQ0083818.1 flagellar motor switch/type III secretory pathway protein FliN [Variovorax boronicumulans]
MNRQLVDAFGGAFELLRVRQADSVGSAAPGRLAAREVGLELMLRPSHGDEQHVVSLWSDPQGISSLLAQERWERITDSGPCGWSDRLMCRAEVSVAVARMPLRQLRAVAAGDVIVAGGVCEKGDSDGSDEYGVGTRSDAHACLGRVVLELAIRQVGGVQSRARSLLLRSWQVRCMTHADRMGPLGRDGRDGGRERDLIEEEASLGVFPVESIDMDVHFVAGHIEMSVGALRVLESGSLIPLAGPASARVDIVVHGTRIGIGEMVEIDGRLAIEVLEMCRTS